MPFESLISSFGDDGTTPVTFAAELRKRCNFAALNAEDFFENPRRLNRRFVLTAKVYTIAWNFAQTLTLTDQTPSRGTVRQILTQISETTLEQIENSVPSVDESMTPEVKALVVVILVGMALHCGPMANKL